MSRTKHGSKGPGYDYWSRRHPGNGINGHGKAIKKQTHKYERQEGKKQCEFEPVAEAQCLNCGNKYDEDAPVWWFVHDGAGCCLHCAD